MAKRGFLVPLTVALAALSDTSVAAVKNEVVVTPTDSEKQTTTVPSIFRFQMPEKGQSVDAIFPSGEDLFKFVLHRAEDGQLVAAHESHYSHSSHSSHSSHYSSR